MRAALAKDASSSLTLAQRGVKSLALAAGIAQLVERQLPKLEVAGSSPVARSDKQNEFGPFAGPFFVREDPCGNLRLLEP